MDGLISAGLDRLSEGVGIFDADLRLLYCNALYRDLRKYPDDICQPGCSLEAMIRYNAERGDFGAGDVEAEVAERMAQIKDLAQRDIKREMIGGQILNIHYQHLEVGGLIVTIEDVTEVQQAQTALAASEQRYALISEAAEEGIYEWDIANRKFYSSPRLQDLLQVESSDAGRPERSWEARIHPDDIDRYRRMLEAHMGGVDARWECEYRFRSSDGDYLWISDHGMTVRSDDGTAVKMVAAVSDITDKVNQNAALAASEERHALVAQATSDGLYDWNIVADNLFVSDRLNELFAFDEEFISSNDWAKRVHKDDLALYAEAMRAHLKRQTDHLECDYRITGKRGDYRWVHDQGIAVYNEGGHAIRLVGAVRDITDVRAAELERDQAEKRLLDSLETISDGFLLVDSDDKIQLWNRRYLEIFGGAANVDISSVVYKGRPFLEMVKEGYELGMFKPHPGGAEGWAEDRRKARDPKNISVDGLNPAAHLEMQLANDQWLLINERPMSDGGRVSVYNDITDFKNREAELEAARIRFEDAIESLSSGFVLFDANDQLVACNTKYREYFPKLVDKVVPGGKFSDIIQAAMDRGLFPESKADPGAWISQLLETRSSTSGSRLQHMESGLWLQISDHRTKEGGIVSIYADITELKDREEDLMEAKNAAEEALSDLHKAQDRLVQSEKMASLGQLTAGIAHEIKNPLNFVNNFANLSVELLGELAETLEAPIASLGDDDREDAEEVFEMLTGNLEKINNHGRRADEIVKNMLLHSREGPSEVQKSDLNAIAEEALNLAYHGARAENSDFNIEMIKNLAADIPPVECFPQDLMRVFLNLVSNGMYAANKRRLAGEDMAAPPEPIITLETRNEGGHAVVEIRDNGTGIPADIRGKIFTPFFTTKPAGEGTGLGLSLSYDIVVKQHGGTMSVESEPGEFTAFTVTLPHVMAAQASDKSGT